MKKIFDIFLITLIFFIIYFLQSNFFTWFNIAGIMPNLFVILIMLIGLFMKKKNGFIFGIIFGLLLDFIIGSRIGINAISLAIVGLVSEILDKNLSKDNRITIMFLTVILTILNELIIYCFQVFFCGAIFQLVDVFKILVIEALYNALIIAIIYRLFLFFGNKLEDDFVGNNFLKF